MTGATPVIYFSLGSVAKSSSIRPAHKKILLSAFAKLPYKVLWKYEEDFPNLGKNILVEKWMPQQDVLGTDAVTNIIYYIFAVALMLTTEE